MDELLEITNLVKKYSNITETLHILKGINFNLNRGEKVSITGESGSGKTTFLNMIGGLDTVTNGSVKIEGVDITKLDENEIISRLEVRKNEGFRKENSSRFSSF